MTEKTNEAPEIAIRQAGVPYGLLYRRTERGFVLSDGTVLLESERDASGRYKGGAGVDGMYLATGKLYKALYDGEGNIRAFQEVRAENYLASAEMGAEENYNQIDGIINNTPPVEDTTSIRESLRRFQVEASQNTLPEAPPQREYMR